MANSVFLLFLYTYDLWLSFASTRGFFTWSHIHYILTHTSGWGGCEGFSLHLLTWSMLRSTRLLDMMTHTFGCAGDINVFVHLLTCSMLCSTHLLGIITHISGWEGMLTSLRACSHVRCYTLGQACLARVCTQTLDKCWAYCQDSCPHKKRTILNAEIWNNVYQRQWRHKHRHVLWQMMPKVLKELCACDVAPANEKGKKDRGRRGCTKVSIRTITMVTMKL